MPTLNQVIDKGSITISEIVNQFRRQEYFVDESFQRKLVWTEKQKIRLIETIMIGYPIPEIYLHRQPPDEENDGLIRHSIVDGQQRIKTLSQFMANEFELHSKYLDEESQNSSFANLSWNNFTSDLKNKIREYSIEHRTIPAEVTIDEIRVIFKRLNETDKSLNPQEIRHAEFDGEFIRLSEELANHPIWRKFGVFTDNNIRRMADVEFTTSLLSLLRNGLVSDTTKAINDLYDLFNDRYEDADKDRGEVVRRLEIIDQILSSEGSVRNFFSKPVHIFTLFHLVPDFESKLRISDLVEKLNDFVKGYESDELNAVFEEYRAGSVQRTRSKTSRELRSDALRLFVLGAE